MVKGRPPGVVTTRQNVQNLHLLNGGSAHRPWLLSEMESHSLSLRRASALKEEKLKDTVGKDETMNSNMNQEKPCEILFGMHRYRDLAFEQNVLNQRIDGTLKS